jgi:hypothetical protein
MTTESPAILMVSVEVSEEDADELDRWYGEEHGPEKMALPGYVRMRRFRAHDGSPRFLAIYELTDAEIAFAPSGASPEAVTRMRELMSKWKDWNRSVWVEIDSAEATSAVP